MKTILLLIVLCVSACLMPQPEPLETVAVAVTRNDGLCALSKVAIFDDAGDQYQAEGCSSGFVTLPQGRHFQWVDSLGTEIIGFTVYLIKE